VALRVPFATALKMRALIRRINEHNEAVEAERQKLLEEYAAKDADGRPVMVVVDAERNLQQYTFDGALKQQAFSAEYDRLMMTRVLEGEPLLAADLARTEVTTADLLALGELLEEGE
jgi:hypothetical protein